MRQCVNAVVLVLRTISTVFSANYEDIKHLTEIMLLVTTLILTFSFNGIQTISHDDLLEADTRVFQVKNYSTLTDAWSIPSYQYIDQLTKSLKYLHIVLVLGLTMSISLAFSKCAEHPEMWPYWSCGFSICIISGYAILVYSVVLLLSACSAWADMVFPRYSINVADIYSTISKNVHEGNGPSNSLLQRLYRSATASILDDSTYAASAVLVFHIVCTASPHFAAWINKKRRNVDGESCKF
jgi:hypothetical protein